MTPWITGLARLAELVKDGKLPGAVRDASITMALVVCTGYIAKIDRRIEGLENAVSKMSESVIETSQSMKMNAETVNWHGKEIQRHSRELERLWDRYSRVEQGMRSGGLEVPSGSRPAPPSK